MKIKKIKICNISSYAGECDFDFSVSSDKSIVLIGGQNGTGKTSLFTAIKLALYGHLCFNYQSDNHQYFAKIRELINHKAFTAAAVKAFVQVEIEVPNERDFSIYTINRSWEYAERKLTEEETFYINAEKLMDDEKNFFKNYFFTVLPPNLFDFFFFDGEQIADFFATNNYNLYIKNAFLTLCSYDTFELIRRFCSNYVLADDNTDAVATENKEKYEFIIRGIEKCEDMIAAKRDLLSELERELTDIEDKKIQLENQYKKSGGMTNEEKEKLLELSKENEKTKNLANADIKFFIENMFPFIVAKDIADEIKEQLKKEDEIKKYNALYEKLSSTLVASTVKDIIRRHKFEESELDLVKELTDAIALAVRPNIDVENFIFLHDLSKEHLEKVESVLKYIDEFKHIDIINVIKEKESAVKKTVIINKKFRDAMSDVDIKNYTSRFTELSNKEFEIKKRKEDESNKLDELLRNLDVMEKKKEVLLEELKRVSKNQNIYSLTEKVSSLMEVVVSELTDDKFKQLEVSMLSMLRNILRKDNFIDLIELDKDFNIHVYKKQSYSINEIENLIINIGQSELVKRIGNAGVENLQEKFGLEDINDIKKYISSRGNQIDLFLDDTVDLYNKIEFGQLSKGEKQIFILSLYSAMIRVSGQNIPFIIDTPYARIDTEHREQISRMFLPKISEQVIILSTDEEITETYYEIVEPFIAKEYLLSYDEKEEKTVVAHEYFFNK